MGALFISYTGRDPEGEAWADRLVAAAGVGPSQPPYPGLPAFEAHQAPVPAKEASRQLAYTARRSS